MELSPRRSQARSRMAQQRTSWAPSTTPSARFRWATRRDSGLPRFRNAAQERVPLEVPFFCRSNYSRKSSFNANWTPLRHSRNGCDWCVIRRIESRFRLHIRRCSRLRCRDVALNLREGCSGEIGYLLKRRENADDGGVDGEESGSDGLGSADGLEKGVHRVLQLRD